MTIDYSTFGDSDPTPTDGGTTGSGIDYTDLSDPPGTESESESPDRSKAASPPKSKPETETETEEKEKEPKPPKPKKRARKVKLSEREILDLEDDLDSDELDLSSHKFRRKVEGQEVELSIEDALRDYELRSASHGRMREATDQIRRHREMLEALKSDPTRIADLLKELGYEDPYAFAEDGLADRMRLEDLKASDPDKYIEEVRNRDKRDQEIAARRAAKAQAEAKAREEAAQAQKRVTEEIQREMQTHQMEPGPFTYALLTAADREARAAGRNPEPSELVYEAARLRKEMLTKLVAGLEPADLFEMLGEDGAKKVRKYEVDRVKKVAQKAQASAEPSPRKESAPGRKPRRGAWWE